MTNKLAGRAAFILAIGLLVGVAGPARAADPQTDPAGAAAPANPADPQAAAAAPGDPLSDGDRAARADDVKTPVAVTQSQPEVPVVRASPVVAGSQNATWDETSLIGKIFIGFGALLTVASAARMFMA